MPDNQSLKLQQAINNHAPQIKRGMVTEHRFHQNKFKIYRDRKYYLEGKKRWRFDLAWPRYMIAVEIDGGHWKTGGGHHSRDDDYEKINQATLEGWSVLRFTTSQLRKKQKLIVYLIALRLSQKLHFEAFEYEKANREKFQFTQ